MANRSFIVLFVTQILAIVVDAFSITGVHVGVNLTTGRRPFRQNFLKFQSSGASFDLYIQSLQYFTQLNQSLLTSYYQVAGIHGHPYTSWDSVGGVYNAGYCPHASILFPSWHRPYMALFEQLLWNHAQVIASWYPAATRSQYQAAARTFRIPYWDWASNAEMPAVLSQPTITITSPQGPKATPNPLYNYTFHPQPSVLDFPPGDSITAYHSTVRYPNAAGQSQPDLINQQLSANAQAIRSMTYQLLAQQPNYGPFSNTAYTNEQGQIFNSLENMHNGIHGLVGNGGHMGNVPYAAFDPIFWLHHANVDRLFAIWQAIYPDSYTTPQSDAYGTFTNSPGGTEDINTLLTPFHSDNSGTLYTSATARSIRLFGYSYPEIQDWGVNASQLSANVRKAINALYSAPGSTSKRDSNSGTAVPSPNSMDYQWFVNIRVDRNALPSGYFIHFFLGDPPVSPDSWSFASGLVASHTVLFSYTLFDSNPSSTVLGQIPLTHALAALVSSGIISDLTPASVTPLLTSQLSWRVQLFDDSAVDVGAVSGLKIYVVGQEVQQSASASEFPSYGQLVAYEGVTSGKAGGLGEGEEV